jgi:ribosome-binding factor A
MTHNRLRDIKHAQRESLLQREISNFFLQITLDDPQLKGLYVSHVKLSADRSMCVVYFHTDGGKEDFEAKRKQLVLYKPSLRAALSKILHGPYTPNLRFKYDEQFEKQRKIENLFEKLKKEGKL